MKKGEKEQTEKGGGRGWKREAKDWEGVQHERNEVQIEERWDRGKRAKEGKRKGRKE